MKTVTTGSYIPSYFLSILISISFASSLLAQSKSVQEAKIDRLAKDIIDSRQTAGISILVLKDGVIAYNRAFGYADVEKRVPLRTDHIFRIASQTKAVTSLAALMLWEEGRFLLDDPLSKYVPEFRNMRVLDQFNALDSSYTTLPAEREITIRDLFRHTSGISYPVFSISPKINAIYAKAGVASGIGSKGDLKEQMALLAKQPLLHQPGESFTYGLNDDVLGYLIEIWSGQSLDEVFRERIFSPLQMNDTYFHLPKEKAGRLVALSVKDKQGNFTNVHDPIYEGNSPDYPLDEGIYFSGGAGLVSTTADYAKFLRLFLDGGRVKGKRLIGARTLELMATSQLPDYIKHPSALEFGLGVALVTPENKFAQSPSIGTLYWGGAFNTHYWVDGQEGLIGLVYTQEYNAYSEDFGHLFKNVIYSTIEDRHSKK